MKLNKYLSLFLITILLSGCFSNKGDRTKIYIGMWPETQLTQDIAMFTEWKNRFETAYPEYEIIPSRYDYSNSTIDAKAMAGQLPTIFQTWFTEPQFLVSSGYIRAIDTQLNQLGWLDKMDDEMKSVFTINNKVYGVPRDGYGLGLVINLKNAYEFGLLPDNNNDGIGELHDAQGNPLYPQTFDELYSWAEEVDDVSGGSTKGLLILSTNKEGGWQFSNIAWNFGATLMTESNGKYTATLNNPQAIQAMEWIRDLSANNLLIASKSVTYNDWYDKIYENVICAIVGNDNLPLAVTNGGVNRNHLGFVPLPKGPSGHQYSLFGGTPFVFSSRASDKQVLGGLKFLEYMGRSPEVSEAAHQAMIEGMNVAVTKNNPILPTIKSWKNAEYLSMINTIENDYINVNMDNFSPFFDKIATIKHSEVPYHAQELYQALDTVIQAIFNNPSTVNVANLMNTANSSFNSMYAN